MTPEECADAIYQAEAVAEGWSWIEPEEYAERMRDTLAGQVLVLNFQTDVLAASGPVGLVVAFVFFAWRPRDAKGRTERLDEALRILEK